MCEPKSVGGGDLLPPPPSLESTGGERPLAPPPCSYAYAQTRRETVNITKTICNHLGLRNLASIKDQAIVPDTTGLVLILKRFITILLQLSNELICSCMYKSCSSPVIVLVGFAPGFLSPLGTHP